MITIEHVDLYKGERAIFKDLNLNFSKGKSYALIGESGSGKSTLLNLIAGFEKVDNGTVNINNKPLEKNKNFYKYTLGYLFQNFALLENSTINQNLDLALNFKKLNKSQKENVKNEVMKKVKLDIDRKRNINTLSGGEQQRVALARMILKEPKIILADEPTGSLDIQNGEMIIDLLLGLKNQQTVIIIATHDLALAKKFDVIINIQDIKVT